MYPAHFPRDWGAGYAVRLSLAGSTAADRHLFLVSHNDPSRSEQRFAVARTYDIPNITTAQTVPVSRQRRILRNNTLNRALMRGVRQG